VSIDTDAISDINTYGVDVRNRELYLHSYIANSEEDPGVDYKMAASFYKNIRMLDTINHEPIIIHMSSIGGSWGDGMTIFDSIVACESYVTIIAYGQAESMSSIILQAADKRVLTPNAYFMCHFGSSGYEGGYLDFQKSAAFEKRQTGKMLDIYIDACMSGKYFKERYSKLSRGKVESFLKRKFKEGDWYLDANEAVYYGLSDYVLSTRKCTNINSLK